MEDRGDGVTDDDTKGRAIETENTTYQEHKTGWSSTENVEHANKCRIIFIQ